MYAKPDKVPLSISEGSKSQSCQWANNYVLIVTYIYKYLQILTQNGDLRIL